MFLFWGVDSICFYNDAYLPNFSPDGRHPASMGKRGEEVWAEAWGRIKPIIDRILRGEEATWQEDQLVRLYRNGQLENTYWTVSYSAVADESGYPAGVFVTCAETTEKNNMLQQLDDSNRQLEQQVTDRTQQLQQTNDDLRQSNESLQQFAFVASHDLQEPLRKIQAFGDILRTGYGNLLDKQGQDLIGRMESAASRMSTLIRDLLEYSRLNLNDQVFEPQSLNQIVTGVLNVLDMVVQEKKAVIDVGELDTVWGNVTQLNQLFQNLISNALKFSKPAVPPHIRISSHRIASADLPSDFQAAEASTDYCLIQVSDNGIGFKASEAERIFGTFQRLHSKDKYPGSGIGLSITRKVMENHRGYILAEGQPGEGALFSVYLPLNLSS